MRYIQKFFEKVDIDYIKKKYPLNKKIWNMLSEFPIKYHSFLARYLTMKHVNNTTGDNLSYNSIIIMFKYDLPLIVKILQIDNKPITNLNQLSLEEIDNLESNHRYIMVWQNNPNVRNINLKKYTWEEAIQMSKEWHDMIALKAEEEGDITIENESGKIIKKYDTGYYWIDLETDCDLAEGDAMGHCGSSDGNNLYSLRKNQQPFVTISVKDHNNQLIVVQCKGKGNKKPIEKYYPYVLDFYKFMKIDYYESEYIEDEDFNLTDFKMGDLFDLVNNYDLKLFGNDDILTELLDYIEENNLFDVVKDTGLKHELTINNKHIYDIKYNDDVFFKDGKLHTFLGIGEFHKFFIGLPKLDFETFIPITYDISKCITNYLFNGKFIMDGVKIDFTRNKSTNELTEFGKTNVDIFNTYYEKHISDIFSTKTKECDDILGIRFMKKACELNSFENINKFYEPFGFSLSKIESKNTFGLTIDYNIMYNKLMENNVKPKYEINRNGSGLTKLFLRYKETIGTETYNRKKTFIKEKINALDFFKKYMKIKE